ncbi:MAG: type II secretion system protein [Rhodocyclaceae bacterium]|nr:type II secretion system protein [Rhodocyclaceae bacterium]
MRPGAHQRGFTLIEAVIVIALTGAISGVVAVFLRGPITAYFDTVRRADLADGADGALRRMSRDIQASLPNSVRVSGNFIEFIPVKGAGRYRTDVGIGAGDDPLDFTSGADTSFDVLGPTVTVASGDSIVIYNLGQPGADAYEGTSRRAVSSPYGTVANVKFASGGTPFPFASPGGRFQVVSTATSYQCDLTSGVVRLWWGYPIQNTQPTSSAALTALSANSAVLVDRVTSCAFGYASSVSQRMGLVTLKLVLSKDGESVSLMQQLNVANAP